MKKVLFATTALVATAGVAAADVSLSGSARMGIINTESTSTARDWVLDHEVDLGVAMSGSTDSGLSFGAAFNISGDDGENEDSVVFISGAFGKLSIGQDIAEANRNGGIADIGYAGLGVDDIVEDNREGVGANIGYTYTIEGLTFGISADLSDTSSPLATPIAYGLAYKMGALSMNLGYANNDDGAADTTFTSVGVNYSADGLTINTLFSRKEVTGATDVDAFGVSVAYAMDDATTFTVAFADSDASTDESYGLGIGYKLGGGAAIAAGIASVNNVDKSSIGLTFSF